MTQTPRETVWMCDNHPILEVMISAVATNPPVAVPCTKCNNNMYNTGWIQTKEEEETNDKD